MVVPMPLDWFGEVSTDGSISSCIHYLEVECLLMMTLTLTLTLTKKLQDGNLGGVILDPKPSEVNLVQEASKFSR